MTVCHNGAGDRAVRLMSSLAPLRRRAFRILWIGQTVSSAGNALVQLALVFAILHVGGNAIDIGVIAAIQTVARVALILAGGVWADRLRRQFVMLTSDLLRAATETALAVLLITGSARIWELGAGAAIFGAASAFFGPASAGLIPEAVPPEQLQQASSLMSLSNSFLQVGGPAAAGVLVAAFGPGIVFAFDGASFAASAVSLALLRLPPRAMPERASFRRDLAIGWHELAIRPWYWINLIAHACCNLAIPAYLVLGPVIAAQRLGGASAWGALSASFAGGTVAGGLIGLRLKPSRPLVAANLAGVLGALPLLALAPPLATWVIAVASVACGAGLTILNTVWYAAIQQLIPDEARSRVNSYDWLISLVAMPAGYAIAGSVAASVGNTATLNWAAALLAIPLAVITLVPGVRNVRRTGEGKVTGPPLRAPSSAAAD